MNYRFLLFLNFITLYKIINKYIIYNYIILLIHFLFFEFILFNKFPSFPLTGGIIGGFFVFMTSFNLLTKSFFSTKFLTFLKIGSPFITQSLKNYKDSLNSLFSSLFLKQYIS